MLESSRDYRECGKCKFLSSSVRSSVGMTGEGGSRSGGCGRNDSSPGTDMRPNNPKIGRCLQISQIGTRISVVGAMGGRRV